jgi:hypothetical protein
MIRRVFAALDVDYEQWRAISKVALLVDLRASTFVRGPRGRQIGAIGVFLWQLFFYAAIGTFIGAFVLLGGDLFLGANLVLAYVMFMVGTAALLDHNAAITSPDDFHILGFRPVTSRTYLAARIANVLVYTSAMTTLFAYLPIGAFFYRWGAGVGFAAIAAVYGSTVFVAFLMVAAYAWLLRLAGAERLKRLLSYLQFGFSFLVYGGFFFVSQVLSENMLATMTLPKTLGVLLIPSTWFASYLEIAAGKMSPLELVPAAVSIGALAGLGVLITGRLSLDYTDRLSAIASAASPVIDSWPAPRRRLWFAGGESRAIALLIRGQFANDMKFRMSVLAILPLTIIYFAMGLARQGRIPDPFLGGRASEGLGMVTVAMMMFPAMLKMGLGRSDAFRAAWIFVACPSDRTRLVRAAKNVLVVTFILPYLACVALAVAFFSDNLPHVLVHLAFVGLISHLVLQLITLFDPELPFSKPMAKGRTLTRVFVSVIVVMVGVLFFPLVAPLVYRSTPTIVAAFLAVVMLSVVVEWLTRLRIEAQTAKLEFDV